MTFVSQSGQDFLAVSPSTEGYIYINTVGLDIKPVDALPKEYCYVICPCRLYHCSLSAFMIFSNSAPKSSSDF